MTLGAARHALLVALLAVIACRAPCQGLPVLQMVQDFVQLEENQTAVQLGVQLVGSASQPVQAWFSLSTAQNSTLPQDVSHLLEPSKVAWQANETGVRFVQLRSALELLGGLDEKALYVRIGSASNADIQGLRDTTMLVMGQRNPAPEFGFVPNQVAYAGANSSGVRIPVTLVSGNISEPATVRYTVFMLTPVEQQFLPSRALDGFLIFFPDGNTTQYISLPVAWGRVPAGAEYRLGVELDGLWDVQTQNQSDDTVALHLFGVRNGTCPPGSALAAGTSNRSTEAPRQQPQAPQTQEEWLEVPGVEDVFVLVDSSVMELSSRLSPSMRAYGAMVDMDVENVTMCVRGSESLMSMNVVGEQAGSARRVTSDMYDTCGCGLQANASDSLVGSVGDEECSYEAWQLALDFGQNQFNMTFNLKSNSSSSNSSKGAGTVSEQYSLAVVRLADPKHAQMASLTLRSSDGTSVLLCGTAESQQLQAQTAAGSHNGSSSSILKALGFDSAGGESLSANSSQKNSSQLEKLESLLSSERSVAPLSPATKPCMTGMTMSVNVSFATEMITLSPTLMFPDEKGVRVEVNGQVLSRGDEVTAADATDTVSQSSENSTAMPFLPAAFFMGLQPNVKVDIEVVVVAEDGVTSLRYPITVTRMRNPAPPALAYPGSSPRGGDWLNSSDVVTYASPVTSEEQRQKGWPKSPAQQDVCSICPPGWASSSVNASQCTMCPPGTYAAEAQSTRCLPCNAGSYAYSWGSSHCKHCIAGTYAPEAQASLCLMCPANRTNLEDGGTSCPIGVAPIIDYTDRYAVLVSFSVYLTGLDPEDVLLRSGVNAPLEQVVGSLIQSDTASAFNISLEDVSVLTFSHQSRRTLSANVTAALGVELPEGATEEDIAAALEVQKLSADKPMEMLSQDPDRFFGRTTSTLDVEVQSGNAAAVENWPGGASANFNPLFLLIPGVSGILVGAALIIWACRRSPRCSRWWQQRWQQWQESRSGGPPSLWRLPTNVVQSLGRGAQRYARYTSA